jgi:Asp/Glu/hydantoin racemase
MQPAREAFADRFPEARLWNLLDDLLIMQAEAAGGLTCGLRAKMRSLIRHAIDGGADAVLLSCSIYGPVAEEVAAEVAVPVLASDAALFDEAARSAADRLAVLGPLTAGVDDTIARLQARLAAEDRRPTITGVVVEGSREAAAGDDRPALARLVADVARRLAPDHDLILFGQFSVSPGLSAARAAVSVPVLSPPHLAADALRARLTARTPA